MVGLVCFPEMVYTANEKKNFSTPNRWNQTTQWVYYLKALGNIGGTENGLNVNTLYSTLCTRVENRNKEVYKYGLGTYKLQ